MDLALKMEQLPETAVKLVVKVGSQRIKLTHVDSFDYLPTEAEILDCLNDHGFGSEYGFARLIWQNEKSKPVKSVSLSEEIKDEEDSSTVKTLVNGLLEMAAEQRRFLSTLNTTLQQREDTLSKVLERLMESREEVMEERTNALALDLALQDSEKESQFSYKERALETLSNLGQQYIASQSALTPDKIRMLMQEHPELIDEMVKDEAIVEMVASRIMSSKMEGVDADG